LEQAMSEKNLLLILHPFLGLAKIHLQFLVILERPLGRRVACHESRATPLSV
jgi:hypothetical protein